MMIKDCFGVVAQVGDEIFFSRGNAGAKHWEKSVVSRVTDKSVVFSGKTGAMYRHGSDELRRGEGCFVINTEKRGEVIE